MSTFISKATTGVDYVSDRFVLGATALVLLLALYVWVGVLESTVEGPTPGATSAESHVGPAVPMTSKPTVHFY